MTDEARRQSPDDAPAPPATTRWSEDPVEEGDALLQPYVPGRATTPAAREEAAAPSAEASDEHFPFDQLGVEQDEPEQAPISDTAGATPGEAGAEAAGMAWSPADLDFEDAATATEPGPEAIPDGETEAIPEAEVEVVAEPGPEAIPEVEPEPETAPWASHVTGASAGPSEEAAEILEGLARRLREEGLDAVREEMDASHRLTSLIASLVAGYVSGRG